MAERHAVFLSPLSKALSCPGRQERSLQRGATARKRVKNVYE